MRTKLNVNLATSPYSVSPRPTVRSGIGYRVGSLIQSDVPSTTVRQPTKKKTVPIKKKKNGKK